MTYLSRELYLALKPFRRRAEKLTPQSERLLAFLEAAGEANAEQMQNACMLEKKAQSGALNLLVSELFVTVLWRDVTIYESWCTFCYGTSQRWEEKLTTQLTTQDEREAEQILLRQLSQKQVNDLLRAR